MVGMIELLTALLPREATLVTSIKGLGLFRIDRSFPRTPYSYDSEIIILAQGEKLAYLGDEEFAYDPSRYLVLPVPMPIECEGRADPGKPIFGLTIAVDPIEIGEILLEIEDGRGEAQSLPRGIYGAPMTEALYDATTRLLRAISEDEDAKVLAPMIKREIVYRVLRGEKGEILQALARRNRRFFQIARALRRIHESYDAAFDVERLAKELDMSGSTFHSSFKAVTNTSPLQYVKSVRLHKARSLMIRDGLAASVAAAKVGYESPSQFNREYKRLFGATPARDSTARRGGRIGFT
jgi:AraC-like DNA-binding protein